MNIVAERIIEKLYWCPSYLAAAILSSGGVTPRPGVAMLQDTSRVVPTMTTHGAMGSDVVVIDFSTASMELCRDVVDADGFAMDCDHGGGRPELRAAAFEFLKAHPFGSPTTTKRPRGFPCSMIVQKLGKLAGKPTV